MALHRPMAGAVPGRSSARHRGEGLRLIVSAGLGALLLFVAGIGMFRANVHQHRPVALATGLLPGVTLDADRVGRGAGTPPPDAALIVTSLRSQGMAWRGGVRVGDRLEAIDGRPVAGRAALARMLAADPSREIVLHLKRGTRRLAVRLDRGADDGNR